jgi:hypothetical protein
LTSGSHPLSDWLSSKARDRPLLVITGPRESGKTTCLWHSYFRDRHSPGDLERVPFWIDLTEETLVRISEPGFARACPHDQALLAIYASAFRQESLYHDPGAHTRWLSQMNQWLRYSPNFVFYIRVPSDVAEPSSACWLKAIYQLHENWKNLGHRIVAAVDQVDDGTLPNWATPGISRAFLHVRQPNLRDPQEEASVRDWVWRVRKEAMLFPDIYPRLHEQIDRELRSLAGSSWPWREIFRLATVYEPWNTRRP